MDRILLAAIPTLIAIAVLTWLRARWQADSLLAVCYELTARLLPGPPRGPRGLDRALARRVSDAHVRMPSGAVHVPEVIEVTLAEDDYITLTIRHDLTALTNDLANLATARARRAGWHLPAAGPSVILISSPLLHPGWVPPARATRAHDPSDPCPVDDTQELDVAWLTPPDLPRVGNHRSRAQATDPATVAHIPAPTLALPPRLVLREADGAAHTVPAHGATIGRSSSCDITLTDTVVSRTHARVIPDAGTWLVRDTQSANGTYVNGAKVSGHGCPLTGGMRLRIGSGGPELTVELTTAPPDPTLPSPTLLEPTTRAGAR